MSGFFAPILRHPDEPLVGGYLVRLCEANSVPTLRWVYELLEEHTGTQLADSVDLACSPDHLAVLERLIPLSEGVLQRAAWRRWEHSYGTSYCLNGEQWDDELLMIRKAQVCVLCLDTDGRAASTWVFGHVPVCTTHRVALVDACSNCRKPLLNERVSLSRCHACGAALREADHVPVTADGHSLAEAFADERTIQIVARREAEAIGPRACAILFQLATGIVVPGLGETAVPARLDGLPVAARVDALERLAAAWDGECLHASILRAVFEERWPYLRTIFPAGLRKRCARIFEGSGFGGRAAAAIVEDEPDYELNRAVHRLGQEAPYVQSPQEAARYLRLSRAGLADFVRATGLLRKGVQDWGYDADELVHAREMLAAARSSTQLDDVLGFPGAAQIFEHLKLVSCWSPHVPPGQRYAPWDVAAAYDRLWRSIEARRTFSKDTSLRALALDRTGVDGLTVLHVLALVLNGAIAPTSWRPPYRLLDLHFDAEVVRAALLSLRGALSGTIETDADASAD